MTEVCELLREVGTLTEDERLVRGVSAVGLGILAVIGVLWRMVRGKGRQSKDRVKIDVPDSVRVTVDPVVRRDI